ncbi:phage baseplate upper protein [Melissococcus plutonius]|uniref:phage baseplate upper protein n=2 Tax=Melissococcus plutonius TaxID=33970 RepID=UPI0021E580A5|nr:phage baseplate upper protein [Melissococcus plutonius]MCV2498204.1 phage baseplate upper protein [Melissococcus plutonius]MCV2501909.1 phage baseplate upper protein [Melissococcus plutonius]MCV2506819.1 phage baseplate upper protein [Melissococcus plutonius]MCV2527155.1 phage baseplate upper protein [Melissococcus plutonius]
MGYDLYFDLNKNQVEQPSQQLITARVGDGGLRAITVKVTENGIDKNISGMHPVFDGLTADGHHIIDKGNSLVLDPQSGVFRYIPPKEVFAVKGNYQQAFFKLMRDDQTDSTLEFTINVMDNKVEFGINSKDYVSDYQLLVQQLQQEHKNAMQDLTDSFNKYLDELKAMNQDYEASIAKEQQSLTDLTTKTDNLKTQIDNMDVVKNIEYTAKMAQIDGLLGNTVYVKEVDK